MSNTPKFVSLPWPFCVGDISGIIGPLPDFIDNLDEAPIMAFYRNLETFTITTAGSATNGSGTTSGVSSIVLNPITSSSPYDKGAASGGWLRAAADTLFSSFPAIQIPRERCCNDGSFQLLSNISGVKASAIGNSFSIQFWIGTDPAHAGKYIFYYEMFIELVNGAGLPTLFYFNPNRSAARVLNTGTITIGGLTMNWVASDNFSSTSHSGLGVTATSSNYTYV